MSDGPPSFDGMADYSRVPPHNVEAEVCVLGSMILKPAVIRRMREMIGPEDLYRPAHKLIWSAICTLYDRQEPVDLVSVRQSLIEAAALEQVGGIEYVVAIAEGVPNAANAEYYAGQVRRLAVGRKIILLGQAAVAKAFDPAADIGDIVRDLQQGAYELDRRLAGSSQRDMTIGEAVRAVHERLEALAQGEKDPSPPIPTGFADIDFALSGGFRRGELIVLAADTSAGKSTLALNVAANITAPGGGVLYFTGEMLGYEIGARFLQAMCRLHGSAVRGGTLGREDLETVAAKVREVAPWRMRIIAQSSTVADVGAEARDAIGRWPGLDMVVVDYLQLMRHSSGPRSSREERIGEMARGFKNLAMDLGVPVLLLAQLNRNAKTAGKEPPTRHSLRDSGQIEDHANVVMLLWQSPEQRKITAECTETQLCIDKARDGTRTVWGPQAIRLTWYPAYTYFETFKRSAYQHGAAAEPLLDENGQAQPNLYTGQEAPDE